MELNMKENGHKTKKMEMVFKLTLMEVSYKVNGQTTYLKTFDYF